MRTIRIGICDLEQDYLNWIVSLLNQIRTISNSTIVTFFEPEWLVSDISLGVEAFDILLISRELGKYNGAYIAREVVRLNPNCNIVLLSASNRIEDEDYEINNIWFLPKEHVPLRLVTVIDRIAKVIRTKNERYFHVVSNRERFVLPASRVLYMERVLRKTILHLDNSSVETYIPPKEILAEANCYLFVQCHRSIFVNMDMIFSISSSEITMVNLKSLPIGKTFSESTLTSFNQYRAKLALSQN